MDGEDATQFAKRVQQLIAAKVQIPAAQFDGGVWYKDSEKKKLRSQLEFQLERQAAEWLEFSTNFSLRGRVCSATQTPFSSTTDLSGIESDLMEAEAGRDSAIQSDADEPMDTLDAMESLLDEEEEGGGDY